MESWILGEFLNEAWKIWLAIALLLLISEGINPGTFAVSFGGVGALVNVVICFISPGFAGNVTLQILAFSGVTVFSLCFLRPIFVRLIHRESKNSSPNIHAGKKAKTITPLRKNHFDGRVLFEGTEWQAVLAEEFQEDIPVNRMVEVVKREGLTLVIKPQESPGIK